MTLTAQVIGSKTSAVQHAWILKVFQIRLVLVWKLKVGSSRLFYWWICICVYILYVFNCDCTFCKCGFFFIVTFVFMMQCKCTCQHKFMRNIKDHRGKKFLTLCHPWLIECISLLFFFFCQINQIKLKSNQQRWHILRGFCTSLCTLLQWRHCKVLYMILYMIP